MRAMSELMPEVGSDLSQRSNESSAPPEPTIEPMSQSLVDELWRRMTRIYGHRWLSNFGERDDGTWAAGLRGITAQHLAAGFRATVDSGEYWPPSLPQFRALCLGLPNQSAAVAAALCTYNESPLALRMRDTLPSWDRRHMSRSELERHYRAVYADCVAAASTNLLMIGSDQ